MGDSVSIGLDGSPNPQLGTRIAAELTAAIDPPSDPAESAANGARELHWDARQRDLDFIYVGAPKSASTWLFEVLRKHPGAYVLPSKSSGFFETDTAGPVDLYRALLAPAPAMSRVGEIAHDAYLYPGSARRLREAFPQVRIIACLREPGDLAASILKWWATHTRRFGNAVSEMTRHPHFRRQMDYAECLRPFFAEFPAEQIKILFFDDLVNDALRFYGEVCEFIGLDCTFETAKLSTMVNGARSARIPALTKAIYALGGVGRRLGLGTYVERAKRARLLGTLLYSGQAAPAVPEIAQAALRERSLAQSRLASLEQLIGRPVPASWREADAQ